MKELMCSYAIYNKWANEQLLNVILSLKEEQQQQTVVSSFAGLYATYLHVLKAETIWWQRLAQTDESIITTASFKPTSIELANLLNKQNTLWIEWINDLPVNWYEKNIAYKNLKGESFEQPLFEILLHLFNHATYHRGQVVTILRQLGVEKIPSTDYVYWTRKTK